MREPGEPKSWRLALQSGQNGAVFIVCKSLMANGFQAQSRSVKVTKVSQGHSRSVKVIKVSQAEDFLVQSRSPNRTGETPVPLSRGGCQTKSEGKIGGALICLHGE